MVEMDYWICLAEMTFLCWGEHERVCNALWCLAKTFHLFTFHFHFSLFSVEVNTREFAMLSDVLPKLVTFLLFTFYFSLLRWTRESLQCSPMSCRNSRPISSTTVQVAQRSHRTCLLSNAFFLFRYSQSSHPRDSLLPLFWRWGSISPWFLAAIKYNFSETWCLCDGKPGCIGWEAF